MEFLENITITEIEDYEYTISNISEEEYNSSFWNETDIFQENAPVFTKEALFRTIVLAVMTIASFVGNSVTLWSIRRRKTLFMRSTIYKLMFHMAIADLFVTFACLSMETVWTYTVEWMAGESMCRILKYLQVICPF